MASHLQSLRGRPRPARLRASLDDYIGLLNEAFSFGGNQYPLLVNQSWGYGGRQQEIVPSYSGLAHGAFKGNGIVFACLVARMKLFSEARFKFRPKGSYAAGDLYGTAALNLLENPWPQGTTRDLLRLMAMDADLGGTAFIYQEDPSTLRRLQPDWLTIVLGTKREDGQVGDPDTEILGYIYRPNGRYDIEGQVILREQIAQFAPVPDPDFPFRGMSWLQPVVREIMADNATTTHKLRFFENNATPNIVFTLDGMTSVEQFNQWVDAFEEQHKGALNAYKNLFLANGVDTKVVGTDLKQLDFKVTQAHGEVRVCNAAGIPPIIVGVSEGLDSSTYANYGLAKRAWADGSIRPDWSLACGVLSAFVSVPGGSELWFDERQIAYLREDQKDIAEVQQAQATTIRTLVDAGYQPDSVIEAIVSGDLSKLLHTGMYSVQLQPPGTVFEPTHRGLKQVDNTGGGGDGGGDGGASASALWCSHCSERAGRNPDCPKCLGLRGALDANRTRTLELLGEQLGFSVEDVERALGADVMPEPSRTALPALSLNGHAPPWLLR